MAKIVEWEEKLNGTSNKKDDINEDLLHFQYTYLKKTFGKKRDI